MGIKEYLQFENPGVVAIAIGVLIFIAVYAGAEKALKNKAVAIIIALCLGVLTSWGIYERGLNLSSNILAVVIIALVLVVLFFIILPFFKNLNRTFGKR